MSTITLGADKQSLPSTTSIASTRSASRVSRRILTVVTAACVVLAIAGGALIGAGMYTHNIVRHQLAAQQIYFPPAGSPGFEAAQYPGLQRYAGQALDNGPKAKAWADQFMAPHIAGLGKGKPYGQVSLDAFMHPQDKALQITAQTMGFGEVERGLLLSAWGWWVVGTVTTFVGIGVLGAVVLLLLGFAGFVFRRRQPAAMT